MKKALLFSLLSVSAIFGGLRAQETVIVEPGPAGTLNQALANPANQGKIFVLRRGIPYLVTSEIDNTGFELHLRAEDGEGPRPIIIFSPPSGGTTPDQLISARANMRLEGLHLTTVNLIGSPAERIVRTRVDNIRVTVNDCLLDDAGQTAFRLDGKNNRIYLTNSVVSRMGRPANPDNGRVVDDRGNLVDTLWIENCAIYNVTSRLIRDGGAPMNYVYFNQNTVANIGQRGFEWGEVKDFIFTNNIVANGAFLGRQFSLDPGENDTTRFVVAVTPLEGNSSGWQISHNNFFRDPEVVAATPAQQADGDTVQQVPNFGPLVTNIIATNNWNSSNISEVLRFSNPPPFSFDFLTKHHAGQGANANIWDHSGIEANPLYSALGTMTPRYSETHSFSYSSASQSFTGGDQGQPLGSSLFGFTSSVRDLFVENDILFYPNPVRDQLFIQQLKGEPILGLRIFNLQGQELASIRADQEFLSIETSQWKSGAYILSVIDRNGRVSARTFIKH